MEDSHVIHHEFTLPSLSQWPSRTDKNLGEGMDSTTREARRIHLFGIFDGHGGPKIAQFAAKSLVRELENSPQFAEGNFEIAFKVAYCNIDRILRSQHWMSRLQEAEEEERAAEREITSTQAVGRQNAGRRGRLIGGSQPCAHCACPQPATPSRTDTFADATSDVEEPGLKSPKPLSAYATTNESASPPLVTPPTSLEKVEATPFCTGTSGATSAEAFKKVSHEGDGASLDDKNSVPVEQSREILLSTSTQGVPEPPSNHKNVQDETVSSSIQQPNSLSKARAKAPTLIQQPSGITHGLRAALASIYKISTGWWSGTPTSTKSGSKDGAADALTKNGALRATNPALFSGCTAICALLVDNTLYIANAGDSRAVLCRAGRAENLSQDHKPTLPDERQRIYAAGGYVEFGRVNGNLNLSRALGDLIYKQDLSLPPEKQIVSGFPDVRKFELHPEDEFIVMGCDGIWEYYTSQDVVDFIRARFRRHGHSSLLPPPSSSSSVDYAPCPAPTRTAKSAILDIGSLSRRASHFNALNHADHTDKLQTNQGVKRKPAIDLAETVEELFDLLISPNPALFEYGCDNMTAILINLQPGSICDCDCHQCQRKVFQNIFPETAPTIPDDSSNETAVPSSVDRSTITEKQQSTPKSDGVLPAVD